MSLSQSLYQSANCLTTSTKEKKKSHAGVGIGASHIVSFGASAEKKKWASKINACCMLKSLVRLGRELLVLEIEIIFIAIFVVLIFFVIVRVVPIFVFIFFVLTATKIACGFAQN